jgi:acetyl esterase
MIQRTRPIDAHSAALLDRIEAEGLDGLGGDVAGEPEPIALRADVTLPLGGRRLHARLYRNDLSQRAPILLWLHGGGFIGGAAEDLDTTCTAIARRASAIVVSLDYRLAPGHPFPAALHDTIDTLAWLAEHGHELGGDGQLAVGGQSAGGNLAAAAALLARDRRGPAIEVQILCYPALDFAQSGESHTEFDRLLFNREHTQECYEQYLGPHQATALAAPLLADTLADLPPALVVIAGSDPLRDDGRAYAARLRADGVATQEIEYDGAIHAFLNFPGALPYAWRAIDEIAAFVRNRLQPRPSSVAHLQHVTSLYDSARVDELRSFYADALGLREKPTPGAFDGGSGIVWYDAGEGERELHFVPNDNPDGVRHLCLQVSDLDVAAARLQRVGFAVERSDDIPGRPRFFVQDPFGNAIEVVAIDAPYV